MSEIRTSVTIDKKLAERIKKSAAGKKPARGWTVELALLAEAQLDQQDAKVAVK